MAGRAKENFPRGSLKYLFVYLKVRIFKCSYRIHISPLYSHCIRNMCVYLLYIYIHIYTIHLPVTTPLYSQYIPASHPHFDICCCPLFRGQLHLPAEAGGQHLGFTASEDRARALAAAWSDGTWMWWPRPKACFFWDLFRPGEIWRFQLFHFGGKKRLYRGGKASFRNCFCWYSQWMRLTSSFLWDSTITMISGGPLCDLDISKVKPAGWNPDVAWAEALQIWSLQAPSSWERG